MSVGFKAAVKAATRSASVADLGDLTLIAVILQAAMSSGSLTGIPFLAMPGTDSWLPISASFVLLFLSGRLMVHSLGIDRMDKDGISAGGAAHSLRKLGRTVAMAAAVPYCIAGALLEELLFRHLLFSMLVRPMGAAAAYMLQAAAFSAVHAVPAMAMKHGWRIILYAVSFPLMSALILQWLYCRTGSVASPAIVHWALNVSAVWRASIGTRQVYDDAR